MQELLVNLPEDVLQVLFEKSHMQTLKRTHRIFSSFDVYHAAAGKIQTAMKAMLQYSNHVGARVLIYGKRVFYYGVVIEYHSQKLCLATNLLQIGWVDIIHCPHRVPTSLHCKVLVPWKDAEFGNRIVNKVHFYNIFHNVFKIEIDKL